MRLTSVAAAVLTFAACSDDPTPEPAPVSLHRLNRSEYDRTVRDLLGTSLSPALDFPSDDTSHGFDNIADVLALSPVQLELYRAAAQDLAAEISGAPAIVRVDGVNLAGPSGATYHDSGWRLAEGEVEIPFTPPARGTYRFSVSLAQQPLGDQAPQIALRLNDQDLVQSSAARLEVSTTITSTVQRLSIAMLNPHREGAKTRSVVLNWIRIEGPLDGVTINDRVLTCRADSDAGFDACSRQILQPLLRRAYRRPLREGELDRIAAIARLAWDEGERFEDAIGLAIEAILISPHFLFRVESTSDALRADDHALASRLSYFLWSSMPDDVLFELADRGALNDDRRLSEQVSRMLDDPKSDALLHNFAGQWLQIRGLATAMPDGSLFPEFDDALRDAMATEINLFFAAVLADGAPEDLLLADFTFADARLTEHYGLTAGGAGFSRITLDASSPRRGLLGKGAFQLVSSHPNRTSPVRRGKWVLKELLCSAPPPPPPGVTQLPMDPQAQGTLRQQMEEHRRNPACASCHATMDPIGFGLESFDAIGRWRTEDRGEPIDSSGQLPDGTRFDGPNELAAIIAAKPELRRCVIEKLFTYAMGRGVAPEDNLGQIQGQRMKDLITAIVLSEPFRKKKVSR